MALRKVGFFQKDTADVTLNNDVVKVILSELKLKDFLKMMLVSKDFSEIALDNESWRTLFRRYTHVDLAGNGCMENFKLYYQCKREFSSNKLKTTTHDPVEDNKITTHLYKQLIEQHQHKQHAIWTNYLLSKYNLYQLLKPTQSVTIPLNTNKLITKAKNFMLVAAKLGNPIAMLELYKDLAAPNTTTIEERFFWLSEARDTGLAEASWEYANYYKKLTNPVISSNKNINDNLQNYFSFLVEAANRGHALAAHKLANHYAESNSNSLSFNSIIPYRTQEWECASVIANILDKLENCDPIRIKEFYDDLLQQAFIYDSQDVSQAAWMLYKILRGRNVNQANQYKKFAKQYYEATIPERRERARFWYNEAIDGGVASAVSDLEKLNTLEIQGNQPTTSSPPQTRKQS